MEKRCPFFLRRVFLDEGGFFALKCHCSCVPEPDRKNSLRLRLRFSNVRLEHIFSDIVGEHFLGVVMGSFSGFG